MDIPSPFCVYVCIYMGVCIVYTSVCVFLCMSMGGYMYICFGLPVCAHAWPWALGLLHGFPPPAVLFLWPWCFQPYLGCMGMDVAGCFVFRWGADCGPCAVFNVDEALLGAPRGVPWGSVVVVLHLALSLPVFCSGDALSLRRITGRVCSFL